jgi:hypothetical protein
MTMDPVQDLTPGRDVFSRDGHKIGTVKELSATALKIDAPLHRDYWLPRERVLSFTNERVTMDLDRDEIGEHALERGDGG